MFEAPPTRNKFYIDYEQSQKYKQEPDVMTLIDSQECDICNQKLHKDQFLKLCYCQHEFCKDCLKYYTLHKIKNQFQIITCPKTDCKQTIDKECQTYKNLPESLHHKYQKIIVNIKALSDPSFRICPHCQICQLSEKDKDNNYYCQKCDRNYCAICFNPAHRKFAKCDNAIISIMKRNFNFKRCANCLFVVEKNEGCNHMTCKCGFEFCYLCGGNWNHGNHQCPPVLPQFRLRPIKMLNRKQIQRKPLILAAQNIIFDMAVDPELKPKGMRPQKIYHIMCSALNSHKNSKSRVSQSSTKNSRLINNNSLISTKQN